MDDLGVYCCFLCPEKNYTIRSLNDPCPRCGNAFGFPLKEHPKTISDYRVIKPLGRGFYSAAYLTARGRLNTPYVLKVSSKKIYELFNKNFEDECRLHETVAKDTEHVVKIDDFFDADIDFSGKVIPCHVAVQNYVEGTPLNKFLEQTNLSANTIAQISIDLFRIWREFINKHHYHNDLHAKNIIIQSLAPEAKRAEAVDGLVRAVAVDLGSVADRSKSDDVEHRLGDQHWVARHLLNMVERLSGDPDNTDDLNFRVSTVLEDRARLLSAPAMAQRLPAPDECIKDIREAVMRVYSPWHEPLKLARFSDAYNAQTLEPWYVPSLLVDPDNRWLSRIGTRGPQIVTGMRGCGKTMFLRALQLHARLSPKNKEESLENTMRRVEDDGFLGLFVSCNRLIEKPGSSPANVHAPFERLFVAYCLEALRAVRHLREVNREAVSPLYYEALSESIAEALDLPFDIKAMSDYELERRLHRVLVSLSMGDSTCSLKPSPAAAFERLATGIRKCSPLWNHANVLYLLDDVSTRYLQVPTIEKIFSTLLFQSPLCAFKLTTEAQTLELTLRSPGLIEKARSGRDYEVFDLGAEVYQKTHERLKKGEKGFVEAILEQRAVHYPAHPKATPRDILGDAALESIARQIASTSATARERKAVYHGISALSAVCVGDIGDTINIYELILTRSAGKTYPISPAVQSDCYQEFCSRRLYDLNRRESKLKDFALTFAKASYELLVRSYSDVESEKPPRLRQYTNLYVRATMGDTKKQFEQLRDLIDAGVFVFAESTPRTKTRDGDPIQQFKLTYRKLFGLSNFMGLAERDRFELSGKELEEWLNNPAQGKEILLRNLGGSLPGNEEENEDSLTVIEDALEDKDGVSPGKKKPQLSLFSKADVIGDVFKNGIIAEKGENKVLESKLSIRDIMPEELESMHMDAAILGLGFEERTLESVRRFTGVIAPHRAILVKYPKEGQSVEIKAIIESVVREQETIDYKDVISKKLVVPEGNVLVDITGLAKPALFHAVRCALKRNRKVWVCHTRAKEYYPLDSDIANVLDAERHRDYDKLLEALKNIFTGEKGPYGVDALLQSDADETRRRILCAFSSAKHERLLTLLDHRDYDHMEVVVPSKRTPRGEIARIAAEIAAWNFRSAKMSEIDSNDLAGMIDFIVNQYRYWHIDRGFNFELGLSGSKIQAVACAAVSAIFKLSQCWYIRPKEFDPQRFTKGVEETRYFEISRF